MHRRRGRDPEGCPAPSLIAGRATRSRTSGRHAGSRWRLGAVLAHGRSTLLASSRWGRRGAYDADATEPIGDAGVDRAGSRPCRRPLPRPGHGFHVAARQRAAAGEPGPARRFPVARDLPLRTGSGPMAPCTVAHPRPAHPARPTRVRRRPTAAEGPRSSAGRGRALVGALDGRGGAGPCTVRPCDAGSPGDLGTRPVQRRGPSATTFGEGSGLRAGA